MEWNTLLNSTRLGDRPMKKENNRSPFNSDHDKIIFSGAFRRLARKTQVHPLATNDHIHNRLTHSLEVACVGRSLGIGIGQQLQLPDGIHPTDIGDIVQSSCLAHDIGNPPFGHTGEEAIRHWFRHDGSKYLAGLLPAEQHDLLNFEGNAQGLRVLTSFEYHPYDGGMRLTYATLASFIKYPWTSLPTAEGKRPKSNKYGVFQSELAIFHEIAKSVGLKKLDGDDWYARHPLAYLMEAADDFCYGLLDLEDGLEMGILTWDEIYKTLKPVLKNTGSFGSSRELEDNMKRVSDGRKPSLLRGKIVDVYIKAATKAFIDNEQSFLEGRSQGDLISLCSSEVKDSVLAAKNMAKDKIFQHPRKVELEIGAYNVMATLLEIMCCAAEEWLAEGNTDSGEPLSFRSKRAITLLGENSFHPLLKSEDEPPNTPKYLALMRVIDFISGMTDHYATYLAKQFSGVGK
jgi:dGTPase